MSDYLFILMAMFLLPAIEDRFIGSHHGALQIIEALLIIPIIEVWRRRRTRTKLATLADRLGLRIHETRPILGIFGPTPTAVAGRYRSRNVRFFNYRIAQGPRMGPWSAAGATMAGHSGVILEAEARSIWQSRFFASTPTIPGLEVVATEDDAFDQAVLVRSNDPVCAQKILNSNIRAQFLQQRQEWNLLNQLNRRAHVIISGGEVRYAEFAPTSFGSPALVERLAAKLDFVCDLAAGVEIQRAS